MAAVEQRVDTATVLFTDIVGSTALRTRLGEEAADELRVTHDRLLQSAIEAQRGIVVKHTGDGVMATFSAAVDAVAAAVAIQQAVDAHNRASAQERFDVRVGISVGDVTFEADDCFGLPVIEAQRLEAAAEGGQILCAEIVRHLARGRGGHEFTSVGDLDLKGIPDPVPAVSVGWAPIVHVAMARETPLPPVLSAPAAFDLAGRADELAVLVDAWKESTEGASRAVLISGEPGIGKTRLTIETAKVARKSGGLVIGGRCDEEVGLPYQPFAEALRFQLSLRDEIPAEWFGPLAGELSRLVPELPDQLPGVELPVRTDPESERARLFEAVTSWLHATSASVPVMLVLDDIHWADRPTLLLLRHLLHETSRDSLLIVGTYRSTDLDRSHPLSAMLADLRRDPHVTRLAVDGITADGVAELLERSAGHELEPQGVELANAIHAETAGNPFFVGEVIRHLVESGSLVQRDGRWTSDTTLADVGLPEGVREVVGRRITRLDEPTQRTLSTAAVIGQEFTLPVLVAVGASDEDDVLDHLDAARAGGLVNEVGLDRYRFGHALVRATLLEELTTSRRVRTHRKIGEAFETQYADDLGAVITDLAYHFGEAAAADPEKAVQYATLAGDHAYSSSAADDAVRWYLLALEHRDDDDDVATEVSVLTKLGKAAWQSVSPESADGYLDRAARLAQGAGLYEAMAEALIVVTRSSFNEEQRARPEKIELLDEALLALDDNSPLRSRVMTMLATELVFVRELTRRVQLLAAAREIAVSAGDPRALAEYATGQSTSMPRSILNRARMEADRELNRDARRAAAETGDSTLRAAVELTNAFWEFTLGDGDELRACVDALATLAAGGRNPIAFRMYLLLSQMVAAIDGRLVEAEAFSIEGWDRWHRVNLSEAITYRAVQQFTVKREQGRLALVLPAWTDYLAAHPKDAAAAGAIAFGLATNGQVDDAARRLDDVRRYSFQEFPDEASLPFATAMWAEVAILVADPAAARELRDRLQTWEGLIALTGGISCGPIDRLIARIEFLLDDPAAADRNFAAAVATSQRLGSPVWVARCQLDWAETFIARGDVERARVLVDDADAVLGSLALPVLREQLDRLRS